MSLVQPPIKAGSGDPELLGDFGTGNPVEFYEPENKEPLPDRVVALGLMTQKRPLGFVLISELAILVFKKDNPSIFFTISKCPHPKTLQAKLGFVGSETKEAVQKEGNESLKGFHSARLKLIHDSGKMAKVLRRADLPR